MSEASADARLPEAPATADTPLVSIVIPTWNRAETLRLTLTTALAQDFTDFEVLVIGDGCTDETEAVVASFGDSRVRWHNLPLNSGSGSAPINAGLAMARGRYVAQLAHDDFWFPWHLSGLVATIEETDADWVHPLVVGVAPGGVIYCFGPPQDGVPYAEHHVPPSGWLYRREVFTDIGGWSDHRAISWQIDFDYMRRAALAGKTFACYSRPTTLKFPSPRFRGGYLSGEPAPIQQQIFARMQEDPESLEHDLLIDLAVLFAKVDTGGGKGIFQRVPSRPTVWQLLWWTPRRWLLTRYGMERWPVPQLLYRTFQRRRLRKRETRGLAADLDLSGGSPRQAPGGDVAALSVNPEAARQQAKTGRGSRARKPNEGPAKRERRQERRQQREVFMKERAERLRSRQHASQ